MSTLVSPKTPRCHCHQKAVETPNFKHTTLSITRTPTCAFCSQCTCIPVTVLSDQPYKWIHYNSINQNCLFCLSLPEQEPEVKNDEEGKEGKEQQQEHEKQIQANRSWWERIWWEKMGVWDRKTAVFLAVLTLIFLGLRVLTSMGNCKGELVPEAMAEVGEEVGEASPDAYRVWETDGV